MIQIAAKNYAKYGNVLGTNEIMAMMTQRDLVVLGLSDGVMCGVTGFGWILQKMVVRGDIDWNREGWIIQNVSVDIDDSRNRLWVLTQYMYRFGKLFLYSLRCSGPNTATGRGLIPFSSCFIASSC